MPNTAVRYATKEELYTLLNHWLANIPGGIEHVADCVISKEIDPRYNGQVTLPPNDSNGDGIAQLMDAESNETILIVSGDKIYPPVRFSLMQFAKDSNTGSKFGLTYEAGVSTPNDTFAPLGSHYSKITGKSLALLQGKLEKHIREQKNQDKALGFLGQIYTALARDDTARFSFSEYRFSESDQGVRLTGKDGLAINRMSELLNRKFKSSEGWKELSSTPASYYTPQSPIAQSFTDPPHEKKPVINDPSNSVIIDLSFF